MTLEQQRAAHALEQILELKQKGAYGNYVSYVKALPATILANGLGQALATLKAQGQDGHDLLFAQISCWLCQDDVHAPYRNAQDVLQALVDADQQTYRRAQVEALAYLTWLKKFAVAYLGEG